MHEPCLDLSWKSKKIAMVKEMTLSSKSKTNSEMTNSRISLLLMVMFHLCSLLIPLEVWARKFPKLKLLPTLLLVTRGKAKWITFFLLITIQVQDPSKNLTMQIAPASQLPSINLELMVEVIVQ